MNEDLEQIKMILRSLPLITEVQYNHLINIYDKKNVVNALEDLYLEDNSILLKLGNLTTNLEIDFDNDRISAFDYYSRDVKRISNKSSVERNKQIKDICIILNELNNLIDRVNDVTDSLDEKRGFWISDKVDYCINNCIDLKLLQKIKVLYNEYVEKRNVVLQSYLKYVIMVAKSFGSTEQRVSLEDLIQYGNLGLIRAIELYSFDKNVEFLTYADYWIKQSIMYNSKKIYNQIRVPLRWFDIKVKRGRVFEKLTQELGRYPTNEEVIFSMQEDDNKVNMVVNAFEPLISLDELTENNLNELSDVVSNGMNLSKVDFIVDKTVDLDGDIMYDEMSREIEYYMDLCLDEREKFILRARYGFIDEISVLELSKMYGVSDQRIYQIIHGAFNKLCKNKEFSKMKIYLR